MQFFVAAFNKVLENKDEILKTLNEIILEMTDTSELDKLSAEAQKEIQNVSELLQKHIDYNAKYQIDQAVYQEEYNRLVERYEKAKVQLSGYEEQREWRNAKRLEVKRLMWVLQERDVLLGEFDEEVFSTTVQAITVSPEGQIAFTYKHSKENEKGYYANIKSTGET